MANGGSFSALTRQARKGVSPTAGAEQVESPCAIGSVDDSPSPSAQHGVRSPTGAVDFSSLVRSEPVPVAGREYSERQFEILSDRGNGTQRSREARRDVAAVKVVTRLVQGIAFKPGVAASDRVKSAALRDQLVQVHELASQVAGAAEPQGAHKGWVQGLCAEAIADLIARRNELDTFDEPLDLSAAVRAVCEVLEASQDDTMLGRALEVLKAARYHEATDQPTADDRIKVSLSAAVWDLFDKVTDPRLGSGDFRFTYGKDPAEIVRLLTHDMLAAAQKVTISIASLDLRTAHLQGSLRRLAALIGAEYVARTRAVMNWIAEDGLSDAEFARRSSEACQDFECGMRPAIMKAATRTFFTVEKLAPELIRESEARAERPVGGDAPGCSTARQNGDTDAN